MIPDVFNHNFIIFTCSITAKVLNCLEDMLDTVDCTREYKEEAMEFISQVTGDVLSTVCGPYTVESDACDTRKPVKFLDGSNSTLIKRSKLPKYKTPLFSLIELLDSFSEPDQIFIG